MGKVDGDGSKRVGLPAVSSAGNTTGGTKTYTGILRRGLREDRSNLNGCGPSGDVNLSAARGTARGRRTKAVFARVDHECSLKRSMCRHASDIVGWSLAIAVKIV
jgi:hypothetical protein